MIEGYNDDNTAEDARHREDHMLTGDSDVSVWSDDIPGPRTGSACTANDLSCIRSLQKIGLKAA